MIHVVDASNPDRDRQMHVVYETLRQLGVAGKPVITLFNKQDALRALAAKEDPDEKEREILEEPCRDPHADYTLSISAVSGEELEEFKDLLKKLLQEQKIYLEKVFPYAEAGKVQLIRKYGQLLEEEYGQEGIAVKAYVPADLAGLTDGSH